MSATTDEATIGTIARSKMPLKTRLRQTAGRLRLATNFVLGRQVLDPGMKIFDDDTWYVSYPRSGNTYWRFLTANLISKGEPVDWTNIERFSPDIYVTYDGDLRKIPRPRYIKSHEPVSYTHLTLPTILRV